MRAGRCCQDRGGACPFCFAGAHSAEVEIDPDTGVTDFINYVSIDGCGTVVNRVLLESQIWGGLLLSLGQVFGEVCRYDEDGHLLSGGFMDYSMPHADLAPRVTIDLRPVPAPGDALGIKGVGEAGTIGALPTAINAIMDALRPRGVRSIEMPASPARVWQVLRAAEEGG